MAGTAMPQERELQAQGAPYVWVITRDLLAEDGSFESEVGTAGPSGATDEQIEEARRRGTRFRMLDDDGEPYYEGRTLGPLDEGDPLNDFGAPNAGCTMYEEWQEGPGGGWKGVIG